MKIGWLALSLALCALAVSAQEEDRRKAQDVHGMHQDSKAYIAFLEDPQRDSYQKPHEVLASLGIKEGETIADIGAGSGYFAFRFSRHVGDTGRVYAVDISPEMIRYVNRRIRELNVKNVVTLLADPDDPLLPDSTVDRFFVCDTWHHIENQAKYLGLMKKMLKPGGQVVMIDFQKRDLPVGPPMQMKIAREDLVRQMESNGFRMTQEYTFLPYQYFLVFKPL